MQSDGLWGGSMPLQAADAAHAWLARGKGWCACLYANKCIYIEQEAVVSVL